MSNAIYTAAVDRSPDEPRENMDPSDMDPDDARQLVDDLSHGMHERSRLLLSSERRDIDNSRYAHIRDHYGDAFHLLHGIDAALKSWDESGRETQELKEVYGGEFVTGVAIGERLAVYKDRDFTFTQ